MALIATGTCRARRAARDCGDLGQGRAITLAIGSSAGEYARGALWIVRRVGHACTFLSRASLLSRLARHSHFSLALSPPFAARWRRCPAVRVRWRQACCLSCVLARPAAWPLSAARAVHAAKLLGADTVLRLQYAHVHALLRASRCRRGSRVCVGARVRCRVCARCVCARARSPGPGCGPLTCWLTCMSMCVTGTGFFKILSPY